MDGIYGSAPGPVANRPWFNLVRRTYENWASQSGLNFIYEPNDDGAAYSAAARGVIGVRGDMRVGGNAIHPDLRVAAGNRRADRGGDLAEPERPDHARLRWASSASEATRRSLNG